MEIVLANQSSGSLVESAKVGQILSVDCDIVIVTSLDSRESTAVLSLTETPGRIYRLQKDKRVMFLTQIRAATFQLEDGK